MNRFVHILGALVALFSFSACEINPPPIQQYSIEYSVGDPTTNLNGLVFPNPIRPNCVPSRLHPNPPLPTNVPHATWYNTGSPPLRFQRDTHVKMYFDSPDKINKDGGWEGHPFCDATVFAYSDPDTRTMHLPNPCDYPQSDAYARLACHEMGHINGWPGYHGD